MRWDYPPLDINPVLPGLGGLLLLLLLLLSLLLHIYSMLTENVSHNFEKKTAKNEEKSYIPTKVQI